MKPGNLKTALKGKLSKKELDNLVRSYDIIGDIAIIEIPEVLEKKEKLIASTLLEMVKPVKVVVRKVGGHKGQLRLQKFKILAGERRKKALYKENGVRMKIHIEKVYFSTRFGTERLRIAKQIKKGEDVLVMFSGAAPFLLVFAKNSEARKIVGVELNKEGHKMGEENVRLNKFKHIELYCGDVRVVVPKLKKRFDRVCMPLPKGGEDYLDIALGAVKKGGIVHFYDFLGEDAFGEAKKKVKEACKKAKKSCKILGLTKCGQQSPRVWRICVDFRA